ncbi:MAG TPA: FHA domain-containing protein [Solirubrobacterales bacterium]
MRFQITSGPDAGTEIEPSGERYTVGREDVDFLLADEEVSRQHFELRTLPDGGVEINDLGSRNGTRVDGERISGPRLLAGGEEIVAGMTTIKVEAPPPPPPPDPGATKVSAQPPPDPDRTVAAAEVPPGLGPDDVTAPQPVAPEPPTPPPPSAEPPPPPAAAPPPPRAKPPTPPPPPPQPPAPQRAAAPPPPPGAVPGTPPRTGSQASTGLRVTALVLSIVVMLAGIFALIVVGVALSLDLCDDPGLSFLDDCYDGSSGTRAIGSILSVLGTIASIAFLVFSIQYFSKSRRPGLVLATGIAAVVLLGVGLAVI